VWILDFEIDYVDKEVYTVTSKINEMIYVYINEVVIQVVKSMVKVQQYIILMKSIDYGIQENAVKVLSPKHECPCKNYSTNTETENQL